MLAVNTTVVVLVSPERSRLGRVSANNVRVLQIDEDAPPLDRARDAQREAGRTSAGYLLHDADPLATVAETWAARFGGGAAGELEVAVAETLRRWRAGSLELPDYYLLENPEELAPLRRHWYLGVLGGAAAARVVALPPSTGIVDHLPNLTTGPWWPALDRILDGIEYLLPEQAGQPGEASERPALLRP